MHSGNAVDIGTDSSQLERIVLEWYELNPDIRRVWVCEGRETLSDDKWDIHVIVVLTPVCDSDDISPIWLARATGWQRHLQDLIGRRVHLDWFDGVTGVEPWAQDAEHARVCLASIAWRDCCSGENG